MPQRPVGWAAFEFLVEPAALDGVEPAPRGSGGSWYCLFEGPVVLADAELFARAFPWQKRGLVLGYLA
eukprot:11158626-Lingulodinium_polyedra.AAC.1